MTARVRFGRLLVDAVTFAGALDRIEELVAAGRGGAVFTPNVDHVVQAERNPDFVRAYDTASLSVADGQPLVWASRLLGRPLPEKVSGSDLLAPLCSRAAARGFGVYLLGGPPGVAAEAAAVLEQRGVRVVGHEAPRIGLTPLDDEPAILARIAAAAPQLLFVALGAPKQELFIARAAPKLGPVVALGVGASLEFLVGRVRRAPRWMSRAGLEWLYRLAQDPRRLGRRYLIDDPAFLRILWRTWREGQEPRP